MRGAEAWWENALACLCRRCEFYDVGTGNPTEVLRWRKSPGFCRKVTRLPGAIVRENPGGSRGAPRTRALGAHLSRAPLFLPCLPLSARPGLEPWATAHTGQTSPLEGRREGQGGNPLICKCLSPLPRGERGFRNGSDYQPFVFLIRHLISLKTPH